MQINFNGDIEDILAMLLSAERYALGRTTYIDHDGCDFMSVYGITNFDEDRKRYMLLSVEENIERNGGAI